MQILEPRFKPIQLQEPKQIQQQQQSSIITTTGAATVGNPSSMAAQKQILKLRSADEADEDDGTAAMDETEATTTSISVSGTAAAAATASATGRGTTASEIVNPTTQTPNCTNLLRPPWLLQQNNEQNEQVPHLHGGNLLFIHNVYYT